MLVMDFPAGEISVKEELTRHPRDRSARLRRRRRLLLRLGLTFTLVLSGLKADELWSSHGHSQAGASEASHSSPASGSAPTSTAGSHPSSVAAAPTTAAPPTTVNSAGGSGLFTDPAVQHYLQQQSGDVTAAVYDVSNKTMSLWRPGVAEDTASIVKVDILATLLRQHMETDTLLSSSDEELAETMIEDSDNDSATSLWDEVGQNTAISAFDQLAGLSQTSPGTDGYWGLTTTTAADQVQLLKSVALPGTVLDAPSRAYELGLMENIASGENWGVSAGPTAGTTVALKNGWLPLEGNGDWQVNSIGAVDGNGRDYLIAVLTRGYATEQEGIDTIQGLSSLIWGQLG
jgi:beta-lactamase class A